MLSRLCKSNLFTFKVYLFLFFLNLTQHLSKVCFCCTHYNLLEKQLKMLKSNFLDVLLYKRRKTNCVIVKP